MKKKKWITLGIIMVALTTLIWVQRKNDVEDVIQINGGMPYEIVLIENYGRYNLAICTVENYLNFTLTKRTFNRHKAIYSGVQGDFVKAAKTLGITFQNIPGAIANNTIICFGVIGNQKIERVILSDGRHEDVEASITMKDNFRVWTAELEDEAVNKIEIKCLNSKGEIIKSLVEEL